jgi:type IV pilus assembly protein PilF
MGAAGMNRTATCLLLPLLLALGGCVTETTGGFNAQASPERALRDYIALARGYLEQGDLAAARRHLDNAAAIDSKDPELYAVRALLQAREGETGLADASFRRSLRLDRDNAQTRNNYAAFLYANGRFEEAYRELNQVVRDTAYPARAQAFENLGFAALRLERPAEAEAAFARALQLDSALPGAELELAALALQHQQPLQAAEHYRNYLSLLQFYKQAHSARGLWIGIQLAAAQGNEAERQAYASELEATHYSSSEFKLYRQLLERSDHD